jgi:hypothetical protein
MNPGDGGAGHVPMPEFPAADVSHNIEDPELVRVAMAIVRVRGARRREFRDGLFADPVWDMLLDLFIARAKGKPISVTSLCIASCVPTTTALRWLKNLEDNGEIVRHGDPHDGRRYFVDLSEDASRAIRNALAAYQAGRLGP